MRVLIASHLYPSLLSATGGSFVHNQARFLAPLCDLEIVSPTPWFPLPGLGRWSAYRSLPDVETRDEVTVVRPRYVTLPRRILLHRAWRSYVKALQRAASGRHDVIHAHCAYPDGLAAVDFGRRTSTPVVTTVHGHDLKDLARDRRWRPLVQEALTASDAVIAVSEELEGLAAGLGVAAERLHRVPNGVDCELFRPGAGAADLRRAGEGGWKLIYVGRFDPAKGLGVLLDAMALLRAEDRQVTLELIGSNPSSGTGGEFVEQAQRLGISDRVHFRGEVPWAQLPAIYAAADIFVLPSFSEGLPLVLLEAMACGLPVVSTRCGGPEEVVSAAVGRLAQVGSVEDLAAGLQAVIDGYADYDRSAIRRLAEARYDYRNVAAAIHRIYQSLASAASGTSRISR